MTPEFIAGTVSRLRGSRMDSFRTMDPNRRTRGTSIGGGSLSRSTSPISSKQKRCRGSSCDARASSTEIMVSHSAAACAHWALVTATISSSCKCGDIPSQLSESFEYACRIFEVED
ncbi:hypothetical protein OH76DRAFT_1410153, partial [Lentinus brumalis]